MVILEHNLGNSQVSVYRTIGPTLVLSFSEVEKELEKTVPTKKSRAHSTESIEGRQSAG